jgi:hypothetical protein
MARSTLRRVGILVGVALLVAGGGLFTLGRLATSPAPVPPEPPRVADPASRRSLAAGEVVGFEGRYGSHVWLGIPYPKPPAGERRWRAPAPPEPWTGVRESLAFGSRCPQLAHLLCRRRRCGARHPHRAGGLSLPERVRAARRGGPRSAGGRAPSPDLVRALEWVRDNVEGFGGDPGASRSSASRRVGGTS